MVEEVTKLNQQIPDVELDDFSDKLLDKVSFMFTNIKVPLNQQGVINPGWIVQVLVSLQIDNFRLHLKNVKLEASYAYMVDQPISEFLHDRTLWTKGLIDFVKKAMTDYVDREASKAKDLIEKQKSKIINPANSPKPLIVGG